MNPSPSINIHRILCDVSRPLWETGFLGNSRESIGGIQRDMKILANIINPSPSKLLPGFSQRDHVQGAICFLRFLTVQWFLIFIPTVSSPHPVVYKITPSNSFRSYKYIMDFPASVALLLAPIPKGQIFPARSHCVNSNDVRVKAQVRIIIYYV